MNVRLEYQLEFEDYAEAMREHTRRTGNANRLRGALGWIIFSGLALVFYAYLTVRERAGVRATTRPGSVGIGELLREIARHWPMVLIGVAALLVTWIVFRMLLRSQYRTLWYGQRLIREPKVIEASADRLATTSRLSTSIYQWEAFERHVETPGLFVLYLSKYGTELVPKRAFATPADVDGFRELLRRNVGVAQAAFPVVGVGDVSTNKDGQDANRHD